MKQPYLHCGDCLELLKDIQDCSVDMVLTDPPYGIAFLSSDWDKAVPPVHVWEELLRVIKPGGYLLTFGGTRTIHRIGTYVEDAGFEIRDMMAWMFGSGFPKGINVGKAIDKMNGVERPVIGERLAHDITCNGLMARKGRRVYEYTAAGSEESAKWEGWNTALKPAFEPIIIARKPVEGTVAENCLKYGTGAMNVDACRVESDETVRRSGAKSTFGKSGFKAYEAQDRSGRWPANIIHDGSDEVLSLFPSSTSRSGVKRPHPPATNGIGRGLGAWEAVVGHDDTGSNARFFYCAKASKSERGENNNHPTVKPLALMEYLLTLCSREESVVLDPFMGSGTTGMACVRTCRNFIGFEMNENYYSIALNRINHALIEHEQTLNIEYAKEA